MRYINMKTKKKKKMKKSKPLILLKKYTYNIIFKVNLLLSKFK